MENHCGGLREPDRSGSVLCLRFQMTAAGSLLPQVLRVWDVVDRLRKMHSTSSERMFARMRLAGTVPARQAVQGACLWVARIGGNVTVVAT